ncbi:MAG: tRNA (guanosine(46)-N7)-methyltransferase TrmB [Candidatus Acidiferrum sp.]
MRRSRRMPFEALSAYLVEMPVERYLDFPALYGNDAAVELEIGCGKGAFLLSAAQANPKFNYLGVEIDRKLQLFTATRLAKRGLSNARVLHANAALLLRDRLKAGSIQAVHVYFPDPWWKRRHLKRRLFTADFVATITSVLRPGGFLYTATDVEAYFHIMRDHVQANPLLQFKPTAEPYADSTRVVPFSDGCPPLPQTNFERKARLQGRPVFRFQAKRR